MSLAIFDLDNTLLEGDSDYLWGRFMATHGLVDPEQHEAANRQYLADYEAGTLDIDAYLRFTLEPLTRYTAAELEHWRSRFLEEEIRPIVLPAGEERIRHHIGSGDTVMIITATNAFITAPIARLLGVEHLLATRPERLQGRYTGRFVGVPTFREGKVQALRQWLAEHDETLAGSHFYSDSHNDLPLLEHVTRPVAVDPDPQLRRIATARNWPIVSFREHWGRSGCAGSASVPE